MSWITLILIGGAFGYLQARSIINKRKIDSLEKSIASLREETHKLISDSHERTKRIFRNEEPA